MLNHLQNIVWSFQQSSCHVLEMMFTDSGSVNWLCCTSCRLQVYIWQV